MACESVWHTGWIFVSRLSGFLMSFSESGHVKAWHGFACCSVDFAVSENQSPELKEQTQKEEREINNERWNVETGVKYCVWMCAPVERRTQKIRLRTLAKRLRTLAKPLASHFCRWWKAKHLQVSFLTLQESIFQCFTMYQIALCDVEEVVHRELPPDFMALRGALVYSHHSHKQLFPPKHSEKPTALDLLSTEQQKHQTIYDYLWFIRVIRALEGAGLISVSLLRGNSYHFLHPPRR